uniref:Protein kinase domain-containing protein n=1 Tax=Panagrolaimus superbus TaxID=310955 RepID=A0A914Z4E8_9BILA
MAPETLKRNPEYSSKSDVWAFGILAWEVFSYGEKPWPDWENKKIATYIRRGKMMDLPEYTPTQIKNLVAKMWIVKASERPDFSEILKTIIEIQLVFPPPKPQSCTITHIKGVVIHVTPEVEDQDSEDIQITAAAFSAKTPSAELPPSTPGNVGHSTAEEQEQLPKKKKKKHRTGCCLLDYILNKGKNKSYEEIPPPVASSPAEHTKKKKSNKQAISSEARSLDTCTDGTGNVEWDKTDLSTEQKHNGLKRKRK